MEARSVVEGVVMWNSCLHYQLSKSTLQQLALVQSLVPFRDLLSQIIAVEIDSTSISCRKCHQMIMSKISWIGFIPPSSNQTNNGERIGTTCSVISPWGPYNYSLLERIQRKCSLKNNRPIKDAFCAVSMWFILPSSSHYNFYHYRHEVVSSLLPPSWVL